MDILDKLGGQAHLAASAGVAIFQGGDRDPVLGRAKPEHVLTAVHRERLRVNQDLRSRLWMLGTIGATAPFVGLFGTVIGIMHAFGKMATSGGGIASVSAGIAEALLTTAFGLFVAIPAVWAYNYFQNRVDRFTVEMSNSGSEMSIYFLKEVGGGNEKSVA